MSPILLHRPSPTTVVVVSLSPPVETTLSLHLGHPTRLTNRHPTLSFSSKTALVGFSTTATVTAYLPTSSSNTSLSSQPSSMVHLQRICSVLKSSLQTRPLPINPQQSYLHKFRSFVSRHASKLSLGFGANVNSPTPFFVVGYIPPGFTVLLSGTTGLEYSPVRQACTMGKPRVSEERPVRDPEGETFGRLVPGKRRRQKCLCL